MNDGVNYLEMAFGRDEPDVMWCNGATLLQMRVSLGDPSLNDSDGQIIVPSYLYILTPGEAHQYWEDVTDE